MKTRLPAVLSAIMFAACTMAPMVEPFNRMDAYKHLYDENPITILVLPPVNLTDDQSATQEFYTTLFSPLINAGYYVIPPLATLQILQQEDLYNADLSESATLLGEIFGADLILYTSIHQWEKWFELDSGSITVEADYTILSGKTGRMLFFRHTRGNCFVTTNVEGSWFLTFATSTVRTASVSIEKIAGLCSENTFFDLPLGPYSPKHKNDQHLASGPEYMFLKWGE
jgi:hypothetical protein